MTDADMIEAMKIAIGPHFIGNRMPDMSGDPLRRATPYERRRIDEAVTAALAVVQPELDRLRAENARMRSVGTDALTVLKFAFNRIHVLPRSRDTELANDIDKVLGSLRAALSAPALDGEGR